MISYRQVPLACPATGEEEWRALQEVLESGWLAQGPKVAAFEKEFAAYHDCRFALATSSATAGLHLILKAMQIGPGDEVIVPAFTWVATANVVLHCGARPVLIDIEEKTFALDPSRLPEKITQKTKAIIAVHLFGLCAEMQEITQAARGIPVIEDAACAAGARCRGKTAGSLGYAAAFSFHARKVLTCGEGGMVTTQDKTLAERIQSLRNHGLRPETKQRRPGLADVDQAGFNYRMTDLQAAIGLVQIGKLASMIEARTKQSKHYTSRLSGIPWLTLPLTPPGFQHTWQSYVCLVDEERAGKTRDQIAEELLQNGVHTRPGTQALHILELYKREFGYAPDDFPRARRCYETSLALPLHNRLTKTDQEHVVECLRGI